MNYGLTAAEVYSSFTQAISSDFAGNYDDAITVINREIEFGVEKIKSYLSNDVLNKLSEINYEIITNYTVDLTGVGENIQTSLLVKSGTLKLFKVAKNLKICNSTTLQCYDDASCNFNDNSIYNGFEELTYSENYANYYDGTFRTGFSFYINEKIDHNCYYIVASYQVDEDNVYIKSLKSILRDLVCSNFAYRIAPNGSDVWSIGKWYYQEWEKWEKLLENGWKPSELTKIKFLIPNSPIKSIKVYRS